MLTVMIFWLGLRQLDDFQSQRQRGIAAEGGKLQFFFLLRQCLQQFRVVFHASFPILR